MIELLLALQAAEAVPAAAPTEPPSVQMRPDGRTMARYYPSKARDEEKSGAATIECTVAETGFLTACSVVTETPRGYGFGEATIRASRKMKMRTTTVEGKSAVGVRVRISLVWRLG